MKGKHQKHPPLKRAKSGKYHKLEWAIYGTTCGEVETFYNALDDYFRDKYRLTYIDADHSETDKTRSLQIDKKKYTQSHLPEINSFDDRLNVPLSQMVFVNGNHYPGQRQIIIQNPDKRSSLLRRVDQLTQVDLVILPDENAEVFDFVASKIDEKTTILYKSQLQEFFDYIEKEVEVQVPKVKALILAGGKSTRMNEDKSQLKYHGDLSQEVYLASMCAELGLEAYISKSANAEVEEIDTYKVIKDRYVDMGPHGAILSAFLHDPEAAWLVLACDLPYITKESISQLLQSRSLKHYATAFKLEQNPFPEPLIAIYEPHIYRRMLDFLAMGYACPRKVLINSEVSHVIIQDAQIAFNANTQDEKSAVLNDLKAKGE